MPPLYIGAPGKQPGWGSGPIVSTPYNSGTGATGAPSTSIPPGSSPSPGGGYSALPAQATVPGQPSNVLGPQSVRASGPSQGFDPAYLQNLATAIGGLFSRPQGNLSFNPLGNLSEISQPTGFGTAPVPGLPNTLLQDAINGLAFLFGSQAAASSGGAGGGGFTGGGGPGNDGGGGRSPILQ